MRKYHSAVTKVFLVCCIFGYELFINLGSYIGFSNESSTFSYVIRGSIFAGSVYYLPKLIFLKFDKRVPVFLICFFTFWLWYVSRINVDAFLNPVVLRVSYSEYMIKSLFVSFLPATACFIIAFRGQLERVELTLFWMLLFGGCMVLLALYTNPIVIDLNDKGIQLARLNATTISNLGQALSLTVIYILFKNQGLGLGYKAFVFVFGLGVGLPLVVTGGSRAAIIFLFVGIIAVLIAQRKRLNYGHLVPVSILSSSLILLGVYAFNNGFTGALMSRINTGFFTDSNRLELLRNALEGYFNAPILGLGIEPLGWPPHNIIVEAFLANGLFFGLLISYLCFLVLKYAFFIIYKEPDFAILPVLYIVSFLSSLVSGNIYGSNSFWALMASVAGIYLWLRRTTRKSGL